MLKAVFQNYQRRHFAWLFEVPSRSERTMRMARAVRASSAIPGVFPPVQHLGKILVDGGVVDNIPISVARAKGAERLPALLPLCHRVRMSG